MANVSYPITLSGLQTLSEYVSSLTEQLIDLQTRSINGELIHINDREAIADLLHLDLFSIYRNSPIKGESVEGMILGFIVNNENIKEVILYTRQGELTIRSISSIYNICKPIQDMDNVIITSAHMLFSGLDYLQTLDMSEMKIH